LKKLHLLLLVILPLLYSCNNTDKINDNADISGRAVTDPTLIPEQEGKIQLASSLEASDTSTVIKFQDLTLTVSRLIVWDEENKLSKTQEDTAYLYIELGETIEGQLIAFNTNTLENLKIEQRYETSVTIMNEGPHCDLLDWKHYYSEWKPLQRNSNGLFIGEAYQESDWEKFPKVDMNELKAMVRKQCGDEWFALVKGIKSPTKYPSGVGISRYFLKVSGHRKETNEAVTKYIVFEVPMGC
jgi:hypothetical protein